MSKLLLPEVPTEDMVLAGAECLHDLGIRFPDSTDPTSDQCDLAHYCYATMIERYRESVLRLDEN